MLPMTRHNNDAWLPDIFNDFFDNSWMQRPRYTAPAINVMEREKEYDVELAAPGLTKEDFNVKLDADGNLHIEMEKKNENKEEKRHVDAEKIEARMENGVLTVHLPKKEQIVTKEATRQISIK